MPSRRDFLRHTALASGALLSASDSLAQPQAGSQVQPNVLMICADQFRADFVGAFGANPSTRTPNINALARRGTNFREAVCNQPLCSPSRASFLTSRYATETGVWKLELEPDHSLPTIATEFKNHGYTTSFIGKWHVSAGKLPDGQPQQGWIPPGPSRGGFDMWEGANILELVSHPTQGSYFDNAGNNIGFRDEYRVDFITQRAIDFLEMRHERPWLLFLSQLEPHQQNDVDAFVPPARYADSFKTPHIPADLLHLPGNWQSHLPGYYGCIQAIDDCVGRVVETLENTVILFFSDHGNTFRTRMGEYKRSPHESSIRVPLIAAGPGFDRAQVVDELVSLLDITPTLLAAAGITPPSSMRGQSLLSLIHDPKVRSAWDSTAYIQISSSMCARALRTKDWCYCVCDLTANGSQVSASKNYTEFALYSISGDPAQLVNLAGRPEYKKAAAELRVELLRRMAEAGEAGIDITPAKLYA